MGDFKRVVFEDWATWLPVLSFAFFFMIFMITTIRAMYLGKEKRENLAAMPLNDSTDQLENE